MKSKNIWTEMLPDLLPEYYTTKSGKKKIFTKRTEGLMDIIENGIPKTKKPRDVVIIGAGMSGMVAASLLAAAGHKVRIYEGSMRVGGRVLTIREPFTDGLMGEAGAMRLVTSYQLVFKYLEKFKLKRHTFINHDVAGNELIFVNNVKVTRNEYEKNPDILKFQTVGKKERGKTAQELWIAALQPILDLVQQDANPKENKDTVDNWEKVIKQFGMHSVRSYLKAETDYSEGAIEMIEVMLNLESRSNLSLIQQIVETTDHDPNAEYFGITGGMDLLPKSFHKFLEELGVEFHFNHMLSKIDRRKKKKPVLHFEGSKPRVHNLGLGGGVPASPVDKKISTDAVILTIPFPAMRTLQVEPPFSQKKRKVIRELNYNASTKIFLQFSKRFWEEGDKPILGGQVITDRASRFIYFPSTDLQGDGSGIVISSYTWATEARGWDSLTEELQIEYTLNDLADIFGEHIRDYFVVGKSHSWLLDIYSTGEAAMLSPGQFDELEGYIQMKEDNIHFGGDATSFKIAWIEGAIEAGIRTACEVSGCESLLEADDF